MHPSYVANQWRHKWRYTSYQTKMDYTLIPDNSVSGWHVKVSYIVLHWFYMFLCYSNYFFISHEDKSQILYHRWRQQLILTLSVQAFAYITWSTTPVNYSAKGSSWNRIEISLKGSYQNTPIINLLLVLHWIIDIHHQILRMRQL